MTTLITHVTYDAASGDFNLPIYSSSSSSSASSCSSSSNLDCIGYALFHGDVDIVQFITAESVVTHLRSLINHGTVCFYSSGQLKIAFNEQWLSLFISFSVVISVLELVIIQLIITVIHDRN